MTQQQAEQHEEKIGLSVIELTILNYLRSLDEGERTTFLKMARFTGYAERTCKKYVQILREKGFKIVSEKDSHGGGTYITDDVTVWRDYLKRRLKESQSINLSISKM